MVRAIFPIDRLSGARRATSDAIDDFAYGLDAPPIRNLSDGGAIKRLGEESSRSWIKANRLPPIKLGPHRIKIHEPALEQRPRRRLQRRVHPTVQLDLVVQRPKHCCDGFLLGKGWERDWKLNEVGSRNP